jgi:hypothetical protein
VPSDQVRDSIYAMLHLSLKLGDKREKLRVVPELRELSRAIARQLDCPAPEVEALRYHKITVSFAYYEGGIFRPLLAPPTPDKKIPDRAGLQRIVDELGSRLKKRDERFDPTKHLKVVFNRGFITVFAPFENGRWSYSVEEAGPRSNA